MTEGKLCAPACPGCHSRRFPDNKCRGQVLAGIQSCSFLAFHLCGLVWEKAVDSRLRMSGMTEGEGCRE